MNKRGLEFGFEWIFAILVGAFILFFAIYSTTKLISNERPEQDTMAAQQLKNLLTPLGTSLESGKASIVTFPSETKLFNRCKNVGNFGEQEISLASKMKIGTEYDSPGVAGRFQDKYVFSSSSEKGKVMSVFVKPFEYPFKIADLVYLWADEYCFVNPPSDVEEEILSLKIRGINVTNNEDECPAGSKKVCFEGSGCDVDVSLTDKSIEKKKEGMVFYDDSFGNSLMYGAIFSDKTIYECQIKRLMKRASEIALLQATKAEFLETKGCSSNLKSGLALFADSANSVEDSSGLNSFKGVAQQFYNENAAIQVCKIF
jgi:hypothetical protein